MGVPTPEQRLALFRYHLNHLHLEKDFQSTEVDARQISKEKSIETISNSSYGYMPGDVAAVCRDASVNAFLRTPQGEEVEITIQDLVKAHKEHPQPSGLVGLSMQGIPQTSFDDIGGLANVKEVLKEASVWANRHSGVLTRMGIRPPRGVLLYGPPGTGKTMLARAVAHEAAANFISINISDLSQSEVGESEKALRTLFQRAIQSRPSVVFLDEIQALFSERTTGHTNTLHSQLVLELDAAEGVFILAATNCPMVIDTALLRPGRFDLAIFVPPPDNQGRKEIITKCIERVSINPSFDIELLAQCTEGFTGADLYNLFNRAGLLAVQRSISNGTLDLNNVNKESVLISEEDLERILNQTMPSVTDEMLQEIYEWEATRKFGLLSSKRWQ